MKRTILEKSPRRVKRTNDSELAMNMQPMLPSSPGHLIQLIDFHTYYTLRDTSTFVSALGTVFSSERFSIFGAKC